MPATYNILILSQQWILTARIPGGCSSVCSSMHYVVHWFPLHFTNLMQLICFLWSWEKVSSIYCTYCYMLIFDFYETSCKLSAAFLMCVILCWFQPIWLYNSYRNDINVQTMELFTAFSWVTRFSTVLPKIIIISRSQCRHFSSVLFLFPVLGTLFYIQYFI